MFKTNNFFEDELKIINLFRKNNYKFFSVFDPVMDNRVYKFTFI